MSAESLEDLRKQKQKLKSQLDEVEKRISVALGKTLVRCRKPECGRGWEIRELTYIQTHWYEQPSGCTGGDIWREGEGNWKCPTCETMHRLYNKPEIEKLKHLFRQTVKAYD